MHRLPLEDVRGWIRFNERWAPNSLAIYCPFCTKLAIFGLINHSFDQQRNALSASGACPACQRVVRLWALDPEKSTNNTNTKCAGIWIYPASTNDLKLMDGNDRLPPKVRRQYESARNVFRCGEWHATALCCRRTLEAIVRDLLPGETHSGSLHEQLKQLPSKVNLGKPLESLADTLRKGGNLGAHFNEEGDLDQPTALQMIEFVEYLMRYLYVLPGEVESFHSEIAASDGETKTSNEVS